MQIFLKLIVIWVFFSLLISLSPNVPCRQNWFTHWMGILFIPVTRPLKWLLERIVGIPLF
jgi:hypothetical protein